jgi:membrane protein DedA with SNARE-associated domain
LTLIPESRQYELIDEALLSYLKMSFDFVSLENVQEIAHQYGYWAVFLGILIENLGIPLPGETITLAGGFWQVVKN